MEYNGHEETNSTNESFFKTTTTDTINLLLRQFITSMNDSSVDFIANNYSSPSSTVILSVSTIGGDDDDDGNLTLKLYPALTLFEGQLDTKYVDRINPFWLQFYPPNPKIHYIIATIYIIIATIGCIGNALVIYMFIRCKSLRTTANTLIINLAVSDLCMLAKCPIAIYNSFKLGPALGDLGCRLYGFIGGISGTVSITTLTAISIDRYYVVVYPLNPLRSTTKLRARFMLIFIWLYSFTFAVCPALDIGLSEYVPEGLLTTCSFDYLSQSTKARIFMFIFFVAAWLIPFTIITYCYFYILRAVSEANSIQSNKNKNKAEMKLTSIVIGIILLWFLAWTPYSVVALLGISGNEYYLSPLGSMIPALFCKTSACIDPYIYAVTHPRFRMEFNRMFLGQKIITRTSTLRSTMSTSRFRTSTLRESQKLSKQYSVKRNRSIPGKMFKIDSDQNRNDDNPKRISIIEEISENYDESGFNV